MNSRAWPRDCVISDPMQPPPIAEEIDLHVFDLKTMKEVKRALRAHRAYTPNEECFFIFLDVSRDFVARCVAMGVGRILTLRPGGPWPSLRDGLCKQGWSACWKLLCVVSGAGNGRFVKSRRTESEGADKGCPPWRCCEISEERGNFGLRHVWQRVANALLGGCRQQALWGEWKGLFKQPLDPAGSWPAQVEAHG